MIAFERRLAAGRVLCHEDAVGHKAPSVAYIVRVALSHIYWENISNVT